MISIILFIYNLIKALLRLRGFFKDEIKVVLRLPPAKALRANILGITMGLYFVLGITFFQFESVYNVASLHWYDPFILTILFMAGPYLLGGFYTILLAFVAFIFYRFSPGPEFLKSAEILVQWNLIGYGFGCLFAILYNDMVFLYLTVFEKKYKIAFAYRPAAKINIIKSPYEREELALLEKLKPITYFTKKIEDSTTGRGENAKTITRLIKKTYNKMEGFEKSLLEEAMSTVSDEPDFDQKLEELETDLAAAKPGTIPKVEKNIAPLVEQKLEKKKHKLYDFDLDEAPTSPYTILFAANPYIRPKGVEEDEHNKFKPDLIMKLPDLFYHSVDRALRSLESDEVVGNPEIWSRIRVVTIFDDEKDRAKNGTNLPENALLEEYQLGGELIIDGKAPDNLIDPMQKMTDRISEMLRKLPDIYLESNGENKKGKKSAFGLNHIDVIFGMSAYLSHDRCTAHYTDFDENEGRTRGKHINGKDFTYNPDPHGEKYFEGNGHSVNIENTFANNGGTDPDTPFKHEYFAKTPGRIALNVFGANQKTFIHEFAHAMSSAINGAITDEYADVFQLRTARSPGGTNEYAPFYVNRIERKKKDNGEFVPVHKVFAKLNNVVFHSDLDHPSIRENWLGYFPERNSAGLSCVMDRYTGWYRFDQLISNFMYDRLVAKLNRKK